jgi:hypothetical protein
MDGAGLSGTGLSPWGLIFLWKHEKKNPQAEAFAEKVATDAFSANSDPCGT